MNFGKNLQYLRKLSKNMTQETLAEKMEVSRQTVSKWETDEALPEMEKALMLCKIFNCSLDNLFKDDMTKPDGLYSDLRVEIVKGFRYVQYTVISCDPETDAIDRIRGIAKNNGIENPRVIGWDFPCVSLEQTNVYHMHGYTAALVLPEGVELKDCDLEVHSQGDHRYAAIHIEKPFENPFVSIPGSYQTLMDYMKVNGLEHDDKLGAIPCFETDGESMDVYIVCK